MANCPCYPDKDWDMGMISCENCGHKFTLNEAPGAAGIKPDGQFVGRCPECDHSHGITVTHQPVPEYRVSVGITDYSVKFDKSEIENIVIGLENAGDNLCQRVVDLLWLRDWRARFNGAMQ